MAESLAEKLKRLAREKAEARAKAEVSTVAEVTEVANVQPVEVEISDDQSNQVTGSSGLDSSSGEGDRQVAGSSVSIETDADNTVDSSIGSGTVAVAPTELPTLAGQTHPLAMQFMELEQALDSTDASFKVKLRDIHRHLGKDPDLVTQMTEAEIALVVKGLVIFANAEIVEPAKAKTVKAATAAAKKKVISADDL